MSDDLVAKLRAHISVHEWATMQDRAADEIERLRAELDKSKPFAHLQPVEGYRMADEIAKLRAELTAERERAEQWRSIAKSEAEDADKWEAENTKLREALELARNLIGHVRGVASDTFQIREAIAAIDAALAETKGNGDE
jgi:hypothetical protein